jgi:hypothetical protein
MYMHIYFVNDSTLTFVNYRAQKLNKYSLTRKYLLQKQNIIKRKDGVPHEQKPHHNNVLDIHVRMEHDC